MALGEKIRTRLKCLSPPSRKSGERSKLPQRGTAPRPQMYFGRIKSTENAQFSSRGRKRGAFGMHSIAYVTVSKLCRVYIYTFIRQMTAMKET